jgi:hypothetical protein|tara:strand:+ start:608 stop:832 length:225 start_codon:yes stop_codon:yes gene_type:complete
MSQMKEDFLRDPELNSLMTAMAEEAISVKLDYEQSGSELDSGSIVVIHHNSPLLQDENEKLSDVAYNIVKKNDE